MNQLLIVEDDNHIRKGLIKIIDKMNLDISYIFEASDGFKGLDVYHTNKPNVIMTDIRMPGMDGLDFIEKIRAVNPTVKIIILSAYSDFSYAQRAIRYQVTDYLEKPVDKEDLKNLLTSLLASIKKENLAHQEKERKESKLQEYNRMIFKELLLAKNLTSQKIEQKLKTISIQWQGKQFIAGAMFPSVHRQDLHQALGNKYELLTTFETQDFQTIYLHKLPQDFSIINYVDDMQYVVELLNNSQERPITMGLSSPQSALYLSKLMKQCLTALDYKLLKPKQSIILFDETKHCMDSKTSNSLWYNSAVQFYKEKNFIRFSNEFDDLFRRLVADPNVTPEVIKDFLKCLIEKCTGTPVAIDRMYLEVSSLTNLKFSIKQYLQKQLKVPDEPDSDYNNHIQRALMYIEDHYNQSITIDNIGQHLEINSTYFSHLFKKEMGISFIDYLQKYRITVSKRLLIESNYKIYKIAEMVGFTDDKYFYKIFRKTEGVTPSVYRKKHINDRQ